jgi:hypothetical protein
MMSLLHHRILGAGVIKAMPDIFSLDITSALLLHITIQMPTDYRDEIKKRRTCDASSSFEG